MKEIWEEYIQLVVNTKILNKSKNTGICNIALYIIR